VLACGLTSFKKGNKTLKGESRLYRIIVSESAHLIWKLRNARVINGTPNPSAQEVTNRWLFTINSRLNLDRLLTNSKKFGGKALSCALVTKTWQNILDGQDSLPEDWCKRAGVLVGISAGVG
ncbi:hypothetical protein BDP27DRAFT_1241297, partial [Rhodocollybia butyracea]